jgi:hypothetical protein
MTALSLREKLYLWLIVGNPLGRFFTLTALYLCENDPALKDVGLSEYRLLLYAWECRNGERT